MATFEPSENLRSRTFIALLVAQFLAAFNDQAIHASAMFFAIDQKALHQNAAISLMPILFYAPWAIFCTVAGYLADRFSKRNSLIFWKFAEVGITLVALLGFWLGGGSNHYWYGPWIVLSTVFLMGLHSAFFVPAKYGIMPEILQPNMLSRGNGVLESLSFLAVILGTVSGGMLSEVFHGREYLIGIVLTSLAVTGAAASLFIQWVPAANLNCKFPPYVYKPLFENIRALLRSRPLALAVIGIAFFTFLVTFMRATVYMHGETRVPPWSESHTSQLFGLVALGIGLGSPLVGYLSGGKVELGLVPLGALGMIVATLVAALTLDWVPGLIVCIVFIGFFTGFYLVPLFTLLQHRAPKASKGEAIATSNFINVTGAMIASLVFFGLNSGATHTTIAPRVLPDNSAPDDKSPIEGTLTEDPTVDSQHRPIAVSIKVKNRKDPKQIKASEDDQAEKPHVIQSPDPLDLGKGLKKDDPVVATRYMIGNIRVWQVRKADQAEEPVFDRRALPRLLFIAAACMTLLTLVLVRRELPDIMLRTRLWFRWLRRATLEVYGMQQLPENGPVILASNATQLQNCLQIVSSTDRTTRFLYVERPYENGLPPLLRALVDRYSLALVDEKKLADVNWPDIFKEAERALAKQEVVGVSVDDPVSANLVDELMAIGPRFNAPILPVHWEILDNQSSKTRKKHVYIIVGAPLPAGTSREAVSLVIERLGHDFKEQHRLGTLQQLNTVGAH
jgi:MFS family permease